MAHAAYAAELVTKLCAPRQVEPAVYDWLAAFLRPASTPRGPAPSGCACSSWGCSRGLGFGPVVDRCAVCGGEHSRPPATEVAFRWDPDRGGAVCAAVRARRAAASRAAVRAALGAAVAHAARRRGGRETLPADVNRDCREALLEIINHHISGPLKIGGIHCQAGARRRTSMSSAAALLGIRHVALTVARSRGGGALLGRRHGLRGRVAPRRRQRLPARRRATTWRCTGATRSGRAASSTTSASRSPTPADVDAWAAHLAAHGVRAEDAAQDPPRRLAVALLLRPARAAHPDHPPRADDVRAVFD